MYNPRVVVFGSLLSDEECEALIELAKPRLARSLTVATKTGGEEVNADRTSNGMFFQRGESELIRRIEARIARLLKWPEENGEGLQVLHYRPGTEYKPHYDYFDPAEAGTPTILKRGGQRVGTARHVPGRARQRRRHDLPRRASGGRAQARQRRLFQLRASASFHPHVAWRCAGAGGGKVDRHQMAARTEVRVKARVQVKANGISIEVEDTGADGRRPAGRRSC